MDPKIKENIKTCNDILQKLKKLEKTKVKRPDIFVLIDELKVKIKWLKELYKQIIS